MARGRTNADRDVEMGGTRGWEGRALDLLMLADSRRMIASHLLPCLSRRLLSTLHLTPPRPLQASNAEKASRAKELEKIRVRTVAQQKAANERAREAMEQNDSESGYRKLGLAPDTKLAHVMSDDYRNDGDFRAHISICILASDGRGLCAQRQSVSEEAVSVCAPRSLRNS